MSRLLSTISLPRLESGAIHVWRAAEDVDVDHLRDILSADELARAGSYRFERDYQRFINCRATLRVLLGRYLNQPPEALVFAYGPQGKPSLAGDPIHFNVSHTDGLSLLAFAIDQPVGVDVESIQRELHFAAVAQRHFSAREASAVTSSSAAQQAQAFYTHWTAYEASLKLQGRSIGTESLESLPPAWVSHLDVGPDFAAAIAAQNKPRALKFCAL